MLRTFILAGLGAALLSTLLKKNTTIEISSKSSPLEKKIKDRLASVGDDAPRSSMAAALLDAIGQNSSLTKQ